jgi:hypothetical protein
MFEPSASSRSASIQEPGRSHSSGRPQWRIAVPMIGGMISATTLIVIPAIFGLIKSVGLPSKPLFAQAKS